VFSVYYFGSPLTLEAIKNYAHFWFAFKSADKRRHVTHLTNNNGFALKTIKNVHLVVAGEIFSDSARHQLLCSGSKTKQWPQTAVTTVKLFWLWPRWGLQEWQPGQVIDNEDSLRSFFHTPAGGPAKFSFHCQASEAVRKMKSAHNWMPITCCCQWA